MVIDLEESIRQRKIQKSCSKYNSIELLDVIFELNELPDNYNDIADSILVPMARDFC